MLLDAIFSGMSVVFSVKNMMNPSFSFFLYFYVCAQVRQDATFKYGFRDFRETV